MDVPPPPESLDYASPRPSRPLPKVGWVAVATFPSAAAWHSARSVLDGYGIVCRVGDAEGHSEGTMVLEVFGTEVEWVRDLLSKGLPSFVGEAAPTGGFPIRPLPPPIPPPLPGGPTPPPVIAAIPVHTLPVSPLLIIDRSQSNRSYRLIVLFLWLLMILTVATVVLVCWFGGLQ
jgi:hypothetical protein